MNKIYGGLIVTPPDFQINDFDSLLNGVRRDFDFYNPSTNQPVDVAEAHIYMNGNPLTLNYDFEYKSARPYSGFRLIVSYTPLAGEHLIAKIVIERRL